MLDTRTAKAVVEAVNNYNNKFYGDIITLDDAERAEVVKVSSIGGYPVVAIQKGTLTILVRLQHDDNKLTVKSSDVQFVNW